MMGEKKIKTSVKINPWFVVFIGILVAILAGIYLFYYLPENFLASFAFELGALIIWVFYIIGMRFGINAPYEVEIDENVIEGSRFNGRHLRIFWEEVTKVIFSRGKTEVETASNHVEFTTSFRKYNLIKRTIREICQKRGIRIVEK